MIFLKGLIVGLLIGAPIGAVGALVVQRTMLRGIRYGFITGIGSSVADCAYAAIGVFGLTFISDFLIKLQTPLGIGGGILIILMGVFSLKKPPAKTESEGKNKGKFKCFLSALTVGITNPAAVFVIVFSFSYLNVTDVNLLKGIFLILGVLAGTAVWWLSLSFLAKRLSEKDGVTEKVRLISGTVIIILGAVVVLKSVIS